jgi:hypothetical protein
MLFAAWLGCMGKPNAEGIAPRDSYAQRARRGDPLATLYYEGPGIPDNVRYLWEWTTQLRQGSALGPMGGLAPISWTAIDAWSRFTGHEPNAEELAIVFAVDATLRNPPESITLELPESSDG